MTYHRKGKTTHSVDNKIKVYDEHLDEKRQPAGSYSRHIVNKNASLFEMMESADKRTKNKALKSYMGNLMTYQKKMAKSRDPNNRLNIPLVNKRMARRRYNQNQN